MKASPVLLILLAVVLFVAGFAAFRSINVWAALPVFAAASACMATAFSARRARRARQAGQPAGTGRPPASTR